MINFLIIFFVLNIILILFGIYQCFLISKKGLMGKNKNISNKIIGVTLGYGLKPQLCFEDNTIYYLSKIDYILHKEYFPEGEGTWPIDPETGEKLKIV